MGKMVDIFAASSNFYYLEELKARLDKESSFKASIRSLQNDVCKYRDNYNESLANLLYDYLSMACFTETRHTYTRTYKSLFIKDKNKELDFLKNTVFYTLRNKSKDEHRNKCFNISKKYNPNIFLKFIKEEIFESIDDNYWDEGYGGSSWAKIANAAMMYKNPKFTNEVFIDHAVDLEHNNGTVFDKEVLIYISNGYNFNAFLNFKTDNCILDYTKVSYMTPQTKLLYNRAKTLGIIKYNEECSIEDIDFPKPIKWGKKSIFYKKRGRKSASI